MVQCGAGRFAVCLGSWGLCLKHIHGRLFLDPTASQPARFAGVIFPVNESTDTYQQVFFHLASLGVANPVAEGNAVNKTIKAIRVFEWLVSLEYAGPVESKR